MRKYIRWALVIAWAAVIFMFSSQRGEVSSNNNQFIVMILQHIGIDINSILKGSGDLIIRKLAHFTEFFVLYYLLYNALICDISRKKSLVISLIATFLYACSDEIHQGFTPERCPAFKDVLIDTGGGLLCMIIKLISKKSQEDTKKYLGKIN